MIGGADGCPGGWICVERDTHGGEIVAEVLPTTRELVDRARRMAILAVDIPIGLPETGARACDLAARRLLTPLRGSSVFPAPVRAALDAETYADACERSEAACGKRLSRQAFAIMWRIREVDALLRSERELQGRVREIHPELCFHAWAGHPMRHAKRTVEGRAERLALVDGHFGDAFGRVRRSIARRLAADNDILDAFAALWTAERVVRGEARTVPDPPQEDRYGLRMEMVT